MHALHVALLRRQARALMTNRFRLTVVRDAQSDNPYGEVTTTPATSYRVRCCQYVPKGQLQAAAGSVLTVDEPFLLVPHDEKPSLGSTITQVTDASGLVVLLDGPITITDVQPADDTLTAWKVTLQGVRPAPLVG